MSRLFDAVDDRLVVADSASLESPSTAITILFHFDLGATAPETDAAFIMKGHANLAAYQIRQDGASARQFRFFVQDTASTTVTTATTTALSASTEYYAVARWATGEKLSLRILNADGSTNQTVESTLVNALPINYDAPNVHDLLIMEGDSANNVGGRLGYVYLHNAKLNDTQVEAQRISSAAVITPSGAYWKLLGVDSPELDLSGNGNSATVTGAIQGAGFAAITEPDPDPVPVYPGTPGAILAFNTDLVNAVCPATVAAGDLLLLSVTWKSQITGVATTLATPANWTLLGSYVNTAVNAGTDVGSMRTSIYYLIAAGTEDATNVLLDFSAAPSAGQARIVRWTKPAGANNASRKWDLAIAGGSDDSAGTSWSVTGDVNPGIDDNDMLFVVSGMPTDIASTRTVPLVAATGATISAVTNIHNNLSATGTDSRFWMDYVEVTAGTATAVPVFTATIDGTTTNQKGTTAFVRIRLATNPPPVRTRGEAASMRRHFRW